MKKLVYLFVLASLSACTNQETKKYDKVIL